MHLDRDDMMPQMVFQRVWFLILMFVGLCVSVYLGLFQLHVLSSVWDPLFPMGSQQVLKSPLSQALPVPDSLVGALGYFLEALTLLVGSSRRFGRGSRVLILYSLIAMAMGAVSVGLLGYQTFAIRNWCTLCLISALISMRLFFPGLRELTLSLRAIREKKQRKPSIQEEFKRAA